MRNTMLSSMQELLLKSGSQREKEFENYLMHGQIFFDRLCLVVS